MVAVAAFARLCAKSRGGRRIALLPPAPPWWFVLLGVGGPAMIAVGFVGVANGVAVFEPRLEFARDEFREAAPREAPLSRFAVVSMRALVGEGLLLLFGVCMRWGGEICMRCGEKLCMQSTRCEEGIAIASGERAAGERLNGVRLSGSDARGGGTPSSSADATRAR